MSAFCLRVYHVNPFSHAAFDAWLSGVEPIAAAATSSAYFAGMTSSQKGLFHQVLRNRLQLVWGPPGTGYHSFSILYLFFKLLLLILILLFVFVCFFVVSVSVLHHQLTSFFFVMLSTLIFSPVQKDALMGSKHLQMLFSSFSYYSSCFY